MTQATATGETEAEVRDRLVGTWKLLSAEETLKDGSTRPFPQFGPRGKGSLMYQAHGYMSAFLVNPDLSTTPLHGTLGRHNARNRVFAYCGRYEIDAERKQIVHLPEIATDPGFVGSRQVRPYQFEGERLIFSDVEKNDPAVSGWKIVWEKVEPFSGRRSPPAKS